MRRRADISKNGGNCGNKTGRDRRNKKQKGQRAPVKGHSAKLSVYLFACAENMICIHHRSCSEGEPAQCTQAYAHYCEEKQQPKKTQKFWQGIYGISLASTSLFQFHSGKMLSRHRLFSAGVQPGNTRPI